MDIITELRFCKFLKISMLLLNEKLFRFRNGRESEETNSGTHRAGQEDVRIISQIFFTSYFFEEIT